MFPNLLIELKKQRCTQQDLARHIGISRATMQNKLTGHSQFTLREMKAIQGAQFREIVKKTHGDSKYAKEYLAIADLMELHFSDECGGEQ